MTEVAENVFCFTGTYVNWVIIREGGELTLIDGGWPGDVPLVEESIRSLGHVPQDVTAILLTHAHADHMGAVAEFRRRYGTPVYSDPCEVGNAQREYTEQATVDDVVRGARVDPRPWMEHVIKVMGDTDPVIPGVTPIHTTSLDIPGHPVPVRTHGHTSGHSAFYLPRQKAAVTGDALVTGHALSDIEGPQLIPSFFNHSLSDAITALDTLAALDAGIILPGHGDPWSGPIATAVEQARSHLTATA
ncbi:MBL fold metallo-hydrolase [Streptomyces sp. NPDC004291]